MSSDTKKLRKQSCIFGCDKLDVHVHRFPHPINNYEWYSSWVAVLSDKLQDIDPMTVYNNKRVCDYHFKPEEVTAGRRVIFGAVPTLNLTGVFQSKYSPRREHNYASLISGDSSHSQLSTVCVGQSFEQIELNPEKYASHSKHVQYSFECQPSTSKTVDNIDTTINVIIYSWCRSINRILARKITYDGDDELKKAAQIYHKKHCKHKK